MQPSTITQLNQLNQELYRENAQQFSDTRATFWPGWQQLLVYIETLDTKPLKVLDVGCGNGRFANFLHEQLPQKEIVYTGIDSSDELLAIARSQVPFSKTQFSNVDIIDLLVTGKPLFSTQKFDLVVAFGLLHHIPSFELRAKFFRLLDSIATKNGIVATTAWQFPNSPKQHQHIIDPKAVDIDPNELEENDYILDWRAGKIRYRYCHFINDTEEVALLKQVRLKVIDEYFADGKTGNLNHYLILKKDTAL